MLRYQEASKKQAANLILMLKRQEADSMLVWTLSSQLWQCHFCLEYAQGQKRVSHHGLNTISATVAAATQDMLL